MSWLQTIYNRVTSWGNQPSSSRIVFTGRTQAGVYVSPDTALKNATVWACIQYLTKAVGQLPWHVMRSSAQGSEVATTHRADWLLHKRPCPDMGSFTWRQSMLGNALVRGNAYAEIQWDNSGQPYALWPIHPERVTVRRNEGGALEYEVWNNGGNSILQARDVFHIRGFGDGPVGYGIIEYAAQSIGWAQATEVFGATSFAEGMHPSLVIQSKKGLTEPGMKLLREKLNQLYKGPHGERTVILDADMTAVPIDTNFVDSQFIETRQHQVEEICRWFGVPPHKVMHLLRATFSNIEHQAIEVVVDSVTPWVRVFEEEADYKLFPIQNRQGFYTKMSLQALLRGDNDSRMKFYKGLMELGTPLNRILALEDMNGIGPDGEVSFVSNNVQTLDRAIRGQPVRVAPQPGDTVSDDEPAAISDNSNGANYGRRLQH